MSQESLEVDVQLFGIDECKVLHQQTCTFHYTSSVRYRVLSPKYMDVTHDRRLIVNPDLLANNDSFCLQG